MNDSWYLRCKFAFCTQKTQLVQSLGSLIFSSSDRVLKVILEFPQSGSNDMFTLNVATCCSLTGRYLFFKLQRGVDSPIYQPFQVSVWSSINTIITNGNILVCASVANGNAQVKLYVLKSFHCLYAFYMHNVGLEVKYRRFCKKKEKKRWVLITAAPLGNVGTTRSRSPLIIITRSRVFQWIWKRTEILFLIFPGIKRNKIYD